MRAQGEIALSVTLGGELARGSDLRQDEMGNGEGRVGTSPSNERAVLARFAKSETTSSRPRSFKKGLIMLGGAALSQLTFFFFFLQYLGVGEE